LCPIKTEFEQLAFFLKIISRFFQALMQIQIDKKYVFDQSAISKREITSFVQNTFFKKRAKKFVKQFIVFGLVIVVKALRARSTCGGSAGCARSGESEAAAAAE